jgi:hypothetical protein
VTLEQWAVRWHVPADALLELRASFGHFDATPPGPVVGPSEAAVQTRVRLEASRAGWRAWRNNIGAGRIDGGSYVRWGLANDSAQLNAALKSSDLIGIRPRLIGSSDVGTTIGQFVSLECKAVGWKYTGTDRERAQDAWLRLVRGMGGHARFTTGEIE